MASLPRPFSPSCRPQVHLKSQQPRPNAASLLHQSRCPSRTRTSTSASRACQASITRRTPGTASLASEEASLDVAASSHKTGIAALALAALLLTSGVAPPPSAAAEEAPAAVSPTPDATQSPYVQGARPLCPAEGQRQGAPRSNTSKDTSGDLVPDGDPHIVCATCCCLCAELLKRSKENKAKYDKEVRNSTVPLGTAQSCLCSAVPSHHVLARCNAVRSLEHMSHVCSSRGSGRLPSSDGSFHPPPALACSAWMTTTAATSKSTWTS